jgi:hypothetical protein
MPINTIQQSTEVSEVDLLSVSATVHDDVNSVYVREFKAFGPADQTSGVRPLLFTLRLTAATAEALALQAPIQTF